jgi:hypothetical protein
MAEQLDVNAEARRKQYAMYDVSLRSEEHPEDRAHRHRVEWLDARFQQGKSTFLFVFALGGVIMVLWYCVETIREPTTIPEEKKWALAALTTIVSGLLGFVTGKALK